MCIVLFCAMPWLLSKIMSGFISLYVFLGMCLFGAQWATLCCTIVKVTIELKIMVSVTLQQ